MKKLAIDGGRPLFDEVLHVGRPNIGNRDDLMRRINEMLDRDWLTNRGPLVLEFEEKLAAFLGVKHCISMCNGTVALEIAARALELEGEVIVPSLTFIATAHALDWQGITPVFCDIDPETMCIDPAEVEKLITPKTTGIIGVHLYSHPADISGLQAVAEKHNLKLMFDASHGFGCSYDGQMIGNFGECEVFSFHATKFFNTFEGGAVATNDDKLAEKIRLMQNFGFIGLDKVVYPGTNGKMAEVNAAMGLTGLESLDEFLTINKRNYELYRAAFSEIDGIELFRFDESERCNYQYIVVSVGQAYPLSRDELMDILHAENVLVRRYFWPGCHNMEPYRSLPGNIAPSLPHTDFISSGILVFPTGMAVDKEAVERIVELVSFCGATES